MLLLVCAAACLVGAVSARPQGPGPFPPRPYYPRGIGPDGFVPIVSQNFDLNGVDGSYSFSYESADGSARQESGVINNPGSPVEAAAVTGSYTYIGTDGVPVQVNYIADENGFQPVGNIINPAISRSVADQVAFAKSQPPVPFVNQPFPPRRF